MKPLRDGSRIGVEWCGSDRDNRCDTWWRMRRRLPLRHSPLSELALATRSARRQPLPRVPPDRCRQPDVSHGTPNRCGATLACAPRSGLVRARRTCHQSCHVHRKGERNEPTAVSARCSRMPKKSPPTKVPEPPPVAGWRCDLCGEIVVTTKERPLAPPERCPRCHSDRITPMEVWAARGPNVGLWTR
jgi:hypothetical protein